MSMLDSLAINALLGTRKQAFMALPIEGAVGALVDAIASTSAPDEARLLRVAAVLDICQQAGWVPPPAAEAAPPAAAPDTQALPPAALIPVLEQVFTEGFERLGHLSLLKLAGKNWRVPPHLLVDLLEKARRDAPLRSLLGPVLGERGRWLAAQNSLWQVQAIERSQLIDNDVWSFGSLDERVVYLSALRQRDPGTARSRLNAALKELDARERAALTRTFIDGLSADDEPLLEALCEDRSKEVRRAAVDLLARLPGSAYGQRMGERLAQCVSIPQAAGEAGGLKGLFKRLANVVAPEQQVHIEPPQTFFAAGKDDQLEDAVPGGEGLGQRAWWLFQVVSAAPLQWWSEHTGLAPEALVQVASRSDWDDALLRGWYQATVREGNVPWATALLERLEASGNRLARTVNRQPLFTLLPLAEQERYWLEIAAHASEHSGLGITELLALVNTSTPLDGQPSAAFCRRLLPYLRAWLVNPRAAYDVSLGEAMRSFAVVLPLELFSEAREGWPDSEALNNRHPREALAAWRQTLTLRETLQPLFD